MTVCGPATLVPSDVELLGCDVADNIEDALAGADAAMALRLQSERMEKGLLPSSSEYARVWGLSPERLALLGSVERPRAHPLFRIVRGDVASWERTTRSKHT